MDVSAQLREALGSRYEIQHVLGRGGMAIVYRARDLKHDRLVAIKVLRPEIASSLGGERFLREIQIEARLQHPHILPLYDSGNAGGLLYYVMPYVEGETLRQRLDREGQLPIDDALALIDDVAEALSYAHSHGVVHRDVKPENILLTGGHAVVADFGIARAVSVAGGKSITSSGLAVGTPAYMSPEQGNGMEADARSDIYSLGCVLFEMLAGEPPFTGPTAQAIIARHTSERPPSLRIVRPSIPREVERAIERALAKVPADRFSTVLRFAESLETAAVAQHRAGQESSGPAGLWAFAGAVVLAVGVLLAVISRLAESLDSGRFVVGALDPPAAGDSTQRKQWMYAMEGALRQIPDVSLTDTPLVIDRVLREGEPTTLSDWLDLAKGLRAGRMVLVAFENRGPDSLLVHASIYDVGRGSSVNTITQVVARADSDVRAQAARIIEQLRDLPKGTLAADPTSYEAQRAFVSGRIALETWDLDGAETYFEEAVRVDHTHAEAHLWLAQIRSWRGESSDRWVGAARIAAAAGPILGDWAPLARALEQLADGDYPQACEVYESLVQTDPTDFRAWYGLGECHRLDRTVVRDTASSSGWRFRSSYDRGIQAYQRAFEIVPSFMFAFREQAYDGLASLLAAESNVLRMGRPASPDTGLFVAYPSMDPGDDTIAFTPFPAARVFGGDRVAMPRGGIDAVARGRERLLRAARAWVEAFPDSARPLLALSRALEAVGSLHTAAGQHSAFVAAQTARSASRGGSDSVEAGAALFRILVKLERFDEAKSLADSLLSSRANVVDRDALLLSGVAALTGRVYLAATLNAKGARAAFDDEWDLFRDVALSALEASQRLVTYAAFEAPVESLITLASQVELALATHGDIRHADVIRCRLLWHPLVLAFDELRRVTRSCSGNGLTMMQWYLEGGDTAAASRIINELDSLRAGQLPGDLALDRAYNEARLLMWIGDTTRAVSHLDRSLNALQATRMDLLDSVWQAASLVRAMALRAQLAVEGGEQSLARRWAEAVMALWNDADIVLVREELARMRAILAG